MYCLPMIIFCYSLQFGRGVLVFSVRHYHLSYLSTEGYIGGSYSPRVGALGQVQPSLCSLSILMVTYVEVSLRALLFSVGALTSLSSFCSWLHWYIS